MLYLASASPRRKEILERAGFSFTAMPTQADESFPAGEQPPPGPSPPRGLGDVPQ